MAIFKLQENGKDIFMSCHYNGEINKIVDQQHTFIKLPGNIMCADSEDGKTIAVGTTTGLFVLDLERSEYFNIINYKNAVPQVKIFNNMIYASFVELHNDQIQYLSSKMTTDQTINFNLVQINMQQYTVVYEITNLANNGMFDIDRQRAVLQIPVLSAFNQGSQQLLNYEINTQTNTLTQAPPTKIKFYISPLSNFIANGCICMESGIVYFVGSGLSMDFQMRINYATYVPAKNVYLFGLQDGSVVGMNEQLQGQRIYTAKSKQPTEVTCFCKQAEAGKPFALGHGSFQNLEHGDSEVFITSLVEIGGALQISNM